MVIAMIRLKELLGSTCCAIAALAFIGCAEESAPAKRTAAPAATDATPTKKVQLGKNVFLEIQGDQRRVVLQAYVCLREGQLEQFLTRKLTKEYESILAVDTDISIIHAALIAAGAEPGKTVRFNPKYQPATGSAIKIRLIYKQNGQTIEVPAQKWVRDTKTKKDLKLDWVFGGSHLFRDPLDETKKPYYAANDGDVICVSNFETAMLDLPIQSSASNDDLSFEANTPRIPPLETPVLVVLEPVAKKK